MKEEQVRYMKRDELVRYLKKLIRKLDNLDDRDYFGTEGWRHYLMGEDS